MNRSFFCWSGKVNVFWFTLRKTNLEETDKIKIIWAPCQCNATVFVQQSSTNSIVYSPHSGTCRRVSWQLSRWHSRCQAVPTSSSHTALLTVKLCIHVCNVFILYRTTATGHIFTFKHVKIIAGHPSKSNAVSALVWMSSSHISTKPCLMCEGGGAHTRVRL